MNAKKRSIYTLYTTKPEPKAFGEIKKLLTAKTAISYVTRDKLNKLAGETTDHQGFVAAVGPYNYKKEFPNLSYPQLTQKMSEGWRMLEIKEKKVYNTMAAKMLKEYKSQL